MAGEVVVLVYNNDQLKAAIEAFVEDGPAHSQALRRQEADGALMVLGSTAFAKLRAQPSAGRQGIVNDAPRAPLPAAPRSEG